MRFHKTQIVLLSSMVAGLALIPADVSSASTATVSAVSAGLYSYAWSPKEERAAIGTGKGITFVNKTPGVPHGIIWTTTVKPECDVSVPVGELKSSSAEWSGECRFSQSGVFTYECSVHRSAMTGTIVVPGTLKAKTTAPSPETQTEATLNGTVEPEGNVAEYYFQYGISSLSENKTAPTSVGAGDFTSHPVSFPVTGLLAGQTYHVELVVTYGAGTTVHGGEQTLTTPSATPPTVEAVRANVKGEHEATLEGKVDPNGGSATEYFFEYATAAEYEAANKAYSHKTAAVSGLPADNTGHAASTALSGLQGDTVYHFRLVAKNSAGGPVMSLDSTFQTASPSPPKEEEPPPPSPSPTASPTPSPAPAPGPGTLAPQPELAPLGPALVQGSLKLAAPHHGTTVRGSLEVSQSGAGGRLEVDLLASSVSLAGRRRAKQVIVGRLVRMSVSAGKVSFSIALGARGKSVLRRHHKLALTVKVTLTPPTDKAEQITRSVILRT